MDITYKEPLGTALDILNMLLAGEEIGKEVNRELYNKYIYNADVEEILLFVVNKLDMELYRYNEKLHLCPRTANQVFGYTNEELRKKIPYINKNEELYLCYFIIMTMITMFYRESSIDTSVGYIKETDWIAEVSSKFDTLVSLEDIEAVSETYAFNFAEIAKVWKTLKDARENIKDGKNDKVLFVKNVRNFLVTEKVIVYDKERKTVIPTDRFKAIVHRYFEERDNKNDMLEFVYQLGGEQNATY